MTIDSQNQTPGGDGVLSHQPNHTPTRPALMRPLSVIREEHTIPTPAATAAVSVCCIACDIVSYVKLDTTIDVHQYFHIMHVKTY